MRIKLLSITLIIILLVAFTGSTICQYYKDTGTLQYSVFGGWLIGSNALYGYAHAQPDPPERLPARFQALHRIVNKHMDSIRHLPVRPDAEVAIYYFWNFQSPLWVYMNKKWEKDTAAGYFKRWASVAPLYADYGSYLITRHPGLFLRYYVWPNFVKYYAPPAKFMGSYNLGNETVVPLIAQWFGWKSNRIYDYFRNKEIIIVEPFSIISAVVNLLFITCFITFVYLGELRRCSPLSRKILLLTLVVWFGNMVFSVLSAPIELRYQLFPLIITIIFLGLLLYPLLTASRDSEKRCGGRLF